MLKNVILALTALVVLGLGTAMAGDCNNDRFTGTYTHADAPVDEFGDGAIIHQYTWTLLLGADGTVVQSWTGTPDYAANFGTASQDFGSWKCRADGKLVITMLYSNFTPVDASQDLGLPDLALSNNFRLTWLFKVNNPNTLTLIQTRARTYLPSESSADPNGGTLGPLKTTQVTYNRLVANDDDLSAP